MNVGRRCCVMCGVACDGPSVGCVVQHLQEYEGDLPEGLVDAACLEAINGALTAEDEQEEKYMANRAVYGGSLESVLRSTPFETYDIFRCVTVGSTVCACVARDPVLCLVPRPRGQTAGRPSFMGIKAKSSLRVVGKFKVSRPRCLAGGAGQG